MITRILALALLLAGPNLALTGSDVSFSHIQEGALLASPLVTPPADPLLLVRQPGVARHETADTAVQQCMFDVPVQLVLTAPEDTIAPGSTVNVDATVNARGALAGVELTLSTEGPIVLGGPRTTTLTLGAFKPGESRTVEIPVTYTGEGRSVLAVSLHAPSGERDEIWEKHEALYTVLESGRATTGMAGFLRLDLRRLEEDLDMGLLEEDTARELARELQTPPVELDQIPRPRIEPTPEEAALKEGLDPVRDPNETFVPDEGPVILVTNSVPVVASAGGMVTVQGTVSWLDENGTSHPAFGMTVQVRDDELIGSELVAQDTTDVNGQYFFVVDNDDGIGAGDRDIFVRFRTANSAVSLETAGFFGAPYEADTAVQNEVPDGTTITENFTCANTGTGPSCGLLTGATYVAAYAAQLNSGSFLSQIVLEWPGSAGSANYDGSDINLRPGDRWDWDVMFHEYGHYVMDVFNFENNPGGPHNIGDCISDVQGSKSRGVRLAWGEGWPTFFGTAGQQVFNLAALNVPRVGDVSYGDTGESNFSYSLEAQDNNGLGEDNEVAVQRILWDLFDAPADGRDTVQVTGQSLFDTVNAADPTTLSAAWSAIRAALVNADDLAYGAITTDHFVGPSLQNPAAGSIVRPGDLFSWNRRVGCSTTFDGDDFDLVFYDDTTLAKLLTVPGLSNPSHTLTLAQYQTLVAANHAVRWAVEGRNTASPATGPYLGENFAVTLNRPPLADAGPDQLGVECTSPAGAPVAFDGTGSSDPDADPLTYAWSAPGLVFSDPTSPTPTATVPKGAKTVTLTVSDGIENDSDSMDVSVVDTTDPVIVCPADITVECNEAGGVSAADPAIAAFLAGASATDVCDVAPGLSNNAPGFFPLGATPVTFTAVDADGNDASCIATVNVVDTTPPEIDVSVSPDMLWPPNHKLVDIDATVNVTDICDATPTFVLTSILSNEPDNGLGDGNTANDIQAADFGTADVSFKLRAERAGPGVGRTYTILYTAEDQSGNTAEASATVVVPHSKKK